MIAKRAAVVLGGCVLALSVPAAAHAASDQSITALGTGQAKVKPKHPNRNASIKRAVEKAYARSVPRAIADAREDAERIAKASGLTLGAIDSVDESVSSPDAYYYGPSLAPFGPDQYCATIVRRVHVRDAAGDLHTVSRKKHTCRVPEFAFSSMAVTFEATPAS